MAAPRKVVVRWWDAHAVYCLWGEPDDIGQEPELVETVGWLLPGVKANHTVVVLNKIEYCEEHAQMVDTGIAIPNEMVVEVRLLKEGKRWKKSHRR